MTRQTQFDLTKHIMQNVNLNNSGLMQREYDVLLHLSMHRNGESGLCFPSVETLANECHIKSRTVNEAVRGLEDKCWMTHTRGGLRGNRAVSNNYDLNLPKIMACRAEPKPDRGTIKNKLTKPSEPTNVQSNTDTPYPLGDAVVVPKNEFKQQYYGDWYHSQADYDKAKRDREAEQRRMRELEDDENCPF